MATAAGKGEPSLWATEVLRLALQAWAPKGQSRSTAGTGEPNLWVAEALGPTCWCKLPGAMVAAADSQELSLWAEGALGPDCQCGLQEAQFSGAAASLGEQSMLAYAFCYPWNDGSPGSCLPRGASFPGISW
jgi:hypothetical protein